MTYVKASDFLYIQLSGFSKIILKQIRQINSNELL